MQTRLLQHLKYHKTPNVSQPKTMYVQNIHNLHPLLSGRIMIHVYAVWTKKTVGCRLHANTRKISIQICI